MEFPVFARKNGPSISRKKKAPLRVLKRKENKNILNEREQMDSNHH